MTLLNSAALLFALLLCAPLFGDSALLLDPNLSINVSGPLLSVPLEFDAAPAKFSPVSGFLVLANSTDAWISAHQDLYSTNASNIILVELYTGFVRPYTETKILNSFRRYKPAAIVIFGEDVENGNYELGFLDRNRMLIPTDEITIPIVNANWTSWHLLKNHLANLSVIPVTVTDDPVNPWKAFRRSWWFPTAISIHGIWQFVNMGMCINIMRKLPCQRNLALVVVSFELVSNFMRQFFLLDPFAGWFMPVALMNVFYSMSWPLHFATAIIVIFFWLELASQSNIQASGGFLTSQRWPAAVPICLITIAEYVSSGARALGGTNIIFIINSYGLCSELSTSSYRILTGLAITLLARFFASLPSLSKKQELISKISLRFFLTTFTFILLIITGPLAIAKIYYTHIGQPVIQFIIYVAFNAGSSLTIAAFLENVKLSKGKSTKKSSHSSVRRVPGSGQSADSSQPESSSGTVSMAPV